MLRSTVVAFAALCASPAFAQSADRWEFSGSVNVFLPTMKAQTVFPPSGGGSSASVDADKILDNLDFTFMGSLEARKGVWGVFTDVIYLDLSASKGGSRDLQLGGAGLPVGASANVNLALSGWSWTVAGTYRLAATPKYHVDLVGGARMLDVETNLDWTLGGNIASVALADRAGSRTVGLTNWDVIVGAKGRLALDAQGKWFMPYYLDVGTGESKWTAQAMAGVGYAFSWGDVVGSWRYLGYEMKSGSAVQDLSFSGPMVSAVFRW